MIVRFQHFVLNTRSRLLTANGAPVAILSRPFDILACLTAANDRIVSREELQQTVWPGQFVTANNMNVQISLLRRSLADHGGGELILTVPGRGYRFTADVDRADEAETAPPVLPAGQAKWRPGLLGLAGAGAAAAIALLAIPLSAAHFEQPSPFGFAIHARVEAVPDTIVMPTGGYCRVDYVFHVLDSVEVILASEDVRFFLVSGEPIGEPSVRGRIYHGSFPIAQGGDGVYHNNLWLPPSVVDAARAKGKQDVHLQHIFHLVNPAGHEVSVPAVVRIIFGPPNEACRVIN